jgi:hypothetical protein
MKLNEELMKAKMTLEDQVLRRQPKAAMHFVAVLHRIMKLHAEQVEDLTEREATKSRMLKDYISSQSQTTPKGSKRRGN